MCLRIFVNAYSFLFLSFLTDQDKIYDSHVSISHPVLFILWPTILKGLLTTKI